VVILVLDSGPGIAPENGEKIFDPFFTTKSDSTGIGLSICRRIISDHRGAIEVGTSPWGGTEFRISIPVAKPAG
jgi:signal transduction histidine kinase